MLHRQVPHADEAMLSLIARQAARPRSGSVQ
jgi:hypothetical protein